MIAYLSPATALRFVRKILSVLTIIFSTIFCTLSIDELFWQKKSAFSLLTSRSTAAAFPPALIMFAASLRLPQIAA